MIGYQCAQLRHPIAFDDAKTMTGVTLNTGVNKYGPYRHTFNGCTVTRRLGPTGVPRRGNLELSGCHDKAIRAVDKLTEYAKEGFEEVCAMEAPFSGKPYPCKFKEPDQYRRPTAERIRYAPVIVKDKTTDEKIDAIRKKVKSLTIKGGEYTGRFFLKSAGGHWLLNVDKNAERQSHRAALESKWEQQADALLASTNAGIFMCISCCELPAAEDSFLLCRSCVIKLAMNYNSSAQENDDSDGEDSFDFNHIQNRKNRGLQNDGKQKLRQHTNKRGTKCPCCREEVAFIYVCLRCEKVKLCAACKLLHDEHALSDGWTEIGNWVPDKKLMSTLLYPSLDEGYSVEGRPLREEELAHILAVKYPGFTNKTTVIAGEEYLSLAYREARKHAAMLVGHYIFKKTFTALGKMLGEKTDTVKKFCTRARHDYWTVMLKKPIPTEAQTALSSYMLRDLYPRYVTEGMQVLVGRGY